MIRDYQIVISAIILASAIIWHAQNGQYQIAVFSRQDFVKFDTRTGTVQLCVLEPKNCYHWEKVRLQEDAKNLKHLKDYYTQRMKEEETKNNGR
jgi:hypothetical protein